MTNFILIAAMCPLLMGQAANPDSKPVAKKPPAAKKPSAAIKSSVAKKTEPKRHPDGRPLGVPFEAVKISEGAWRTVEKGVPVIYRTGPFGPYQVSEAENAIVESRLSGKPLESDVAPENLSVVEEGDKLRFRASTPFGPGPNWVKDKNDLTPAEKAAWGKLKGAAKK